MKKLFKAEGLTFNDIATVIENCNGKIEERKYSDADAEIIFNRGIEKGRAEEARKKELLVPADFYDDGRTPALERDRAVLPEQQPSDLQSKEQEFVDEMAGKTMWREPTERQAKWLLSIFIKLGGRRSR